MAHVFCNFCKAGRRAPVLFNLSPETVTMVVGHASREVVSGLMVALGLCGVHADKLRERQPRLPIFPIGVTEKNLWRKPATEVAALPEDIQIAATIAFKGWLGVWPKSSEQQLLGARKAVEEYIAVRRQAQMRAIREEGRPFVVGARPVPLAAVLAQPSPNVEAKKPDAGEKAKAEQKAMLDALRGGRPAFEGHVPSHNPRRDDPNYGACKKLQVAKSDGGNGKKSKGGKNHKKAA